MNLLRRLLRDRRSALRLGFLALSIGFMSAGSSRDAQAMSVGDSFGISPFWDWRTIDTPNFRITLPKQLEPQAQKIARYYEEAHAALSRELHWQPRNRVNVLVIDNTDAANGMATPVLRFGMLLYLTPPENWFSTSYYDDWLKLLIFHEYTHFLNMDPTRGVYSYFRFVFGDVFMPNTLWPTWMLEGLAVYMETKYSERGGRGRSTYYDMVLRSAVENGKLGSSDWMSTSRLHNQNPWFPAGETPYMFGYHLMNQVSKTDPAALGEMSYRSSSRVPFFINGNLENITGKDWYDHWDEFVLRAKKKAEADLAKIRARPVTKFEPLDGTHDEALGATISPNELHLAYSYEDENNWQKLRLKNLRSGETNEIEDKFLGVGMSFTPDSKTLVYSSLHRRANYYFLSDLKAYDLESGESYWLSERLRAKDPDVSRDGNWVTYTVTENSGVHLQISRLRRVNGKLMLGNSRRLVTVASLDRISNPKFSLDQKQIVYSLKVNGESGEKLMRHTFATGKTETLISDLNYNRFPAFDRSGALHFVSNRSGVENLYRWDGGKGVQVTNLTGGIIQPAFYSRGLYGSVFTYRGWSLSHVPADQLKGSYDTASVTLSPNEAPPFTTTQADTTTYPVKDYSAWSTLAPRQWAPLFFLREEGGYVGGQISGYDQTFEHQYVLGTAYDFTVKTLDHLVLYQNRTLGVNIDVYSSRFTSNVITDPTNSARTLYAVDTAAGAALSFPFQFTTSILEPTLGVSVERDTDFETVGGSKNTLRRTRYVPVQDFTLTYSDTRSSRLAVTPERGRRTLLGVRRYDDSEIESYKLMAKHSEHFHLGKHWVLVPTVRGMKVSRENFRYLDANAVLSGERSRFYNLLPGDGYDELGIRGYPSLLIAEKEVYAGSLDLRFPLAHIFRSWGTNPVILNQLSMNLFGETAYIPSFPSSVRYLPSVGAGLRLSTQWLNIIPLSINLEYQKGLNDRARAEDAIFLSVNSSGLPFEF